MKRINSFFGGVLVTLLVVSCASVGTNLVRLQDRELLIHPDKPVLAFPYKKLNCFNRPWALRWMGKKCYSEKDIIEYDMNKKSDREKLINSAFTCTSKMRFKY